MRRVAGAAWVAAGLAALAIGWQLAPAAPPLYDGVGFPDEPYRYADGQGKVPGTPTVREPLTAGRNAGGFLLVSDESGPQVTVYVPTGALKAAAGQTVATVAATPLAPDGQPADGRITGNVYRVTATAGLDAAVAGTIVLRAPVGFAVTPVVEFRSGTGGSWQDVPTTKVGNDVFQATFDRLGDYATVLPAHGSPAGSGAGRTALAVVIACVAAVLLLLLGVRLARRHRTAAP